MLKRTLVFTTGGGLSLRLRQLVWHGEDGRETTVPLEDIGFLMLESPKITVTTALLQALTEAAVAVIVCDAAHYPSGYLLPYRTHTLAHRIQTAQLSLSEARKRMLWQRIVAAKIRNQAAVAAAYDAALADALRALAARVRRGDDGRAEAQAARLYFGLFARWEGFRRERFGGQPNAALNYGYAVVRAAVARALVCSGLDPALGLCHANQYNHYCLADDMMEPYRPFVDRLVLSDPSFEGELPETGLTPAMKRALLPVLTHDVAVGGETRPLMNALALTTASLARCMDGNAEALVLPSLPGA